MEDPDTRLVHDGTDFRDDARANLTGYALHHNIETGVLVRDPGQVRRLIAHFDGLMGRGGPLEQL